MSVIAPVVYAKIYPFKRNYRTPQVIIGRWFGEVLTVGDASAGYIQQTVLLSQVTDYFGGDALWNLEHVSLYTTVYQANSVSEIQISDGEIGVPSFVDKISALSIVRYGNASYSSEATAFRHFARKLYQRVGSTWSNSGVTTWITPNVNATVYMMVCGGYIFNETLFNGVDNLPVIQIPT